MLFDTHVVLWGFTDDRRISRRARDLLQDENVVKTVSFASVWEICIKMSLGKLSFAGGAHGIIMELEQNGFDLRTISLSDLIAVESLEFIHRDPFDRLLVACAMTSDIPIVTNDPNIRRYDVRTVW
jgi:PIN domain nuclease of toxin-antitoxin system